MPIRTEPFITGEIYHICNRGIDHKPTFTKIREYKRAVQLINYYRFAAPPVRLSKYLLISKDKQQQIMADLQKYDKRIIDIYAYCLMPNHVHFLVKQLTDNGISKFMGQFLNGYVKYFNTLNKKEGPLFLDQFKAVRILTDEQFLHVNRYIHLNPYTSFVVKNIDDLFSYAWSSLPEYFKDEARGICQKEVILSFFKNKSSYIKFISDQADYQRELGKIKHLTLED